LLAVDGVLDIPVVSTLFVYPYFKDDPALLEFLLLLESLSLLESLLLLMESCCC
jgi:hypothetical protein